MGMLDFARDIGRRIFDTDDEAADNIKQHLEIKTTGIKNIEVQFDDGVATISGECVNKATRDNAILMVGNIKGVEKVVSDNFTCPPPLPEEPEPKETIYEIKSGDTLGGIAKQFLGKAGRYVEIFEANKDIISDPNKIYPGQKIRIPLD